MKTEIRTWALPIILAILLVSVVAVLAGGAGDGGSENREITDIGVPVPEPTLVSPDRGPRSLRENDDGVIIESPTTYLTYWNEKMKWGLSDEEIEKYSGVLEEKILVRYYDQDHDYCHIRDLNEFGEELGSVLGLTPDQITDFVRSHREQLVIDHQDSHGNSF